MESRSTPSSKTRAVLICGTILILASLLPPLPAQELAESALPDAPIAEMRAALVTRPTFPRSRKHRWLNMNNVSSSVQFAGEALDAWTTQRNLAHHKWICGYSPAFGNAVTYISDDGKRYDARTIQYDLCGPSHSGQLANYAYDATRTGAFTETGWATSWRLTGNRNVAGVLAWNIADDVGQILVVRFLGKRHDLIRKLAPGLNFARGLVHIDCGIRNFQFAQTHSNATAWQFHVPNEATLYPGPRWWGRQ